VESVRERNDIIEKSDHSMIFSNMDFTGLHVFEQSQELAKMTENFIMAPSVLTQNQIHFILFDA
jgi:hypothetical protein